MVMSPFWLNHCAWQPKRQICWSLLKSKELKPKLSAVRNETNKELLARFSLEEKVLLKRLLRDIQPD